jgi:dTDP-4-amino-4,6-dideoxy-D-galactose acyltransferase
MDDDAGLCRLLDWDCEFFQRRIARVTAHRFDPETIAAIMAWCKANAVECLYFLADPDDPGTVRLAEDHGFRQVDIRITLERRLDGARRLPDAEGSPVIRRFVSADIPALRALARVSHHHSRFYHDPSFARSRCDDLYETWIDKSCHGYADAVLVVDYGAGAVGYVSCHLAGRDTGEIGLFAVGAAHQGAGAGRALLSGSLRWFAEQGMSHVTVVTQGRNCRAQRLYQRGGFVIRSRQLWYHRWFA